MTVVVGVTVPVFVATCETAFFLTGSFLSVGSFVTAPALLIAEAEIA